MLLTSGLPKVDINECLQHYFYTLDAGLHLCRDVIKV
jgi:hypothetical protein